MTVIINEDEHVPTQENPEVPMQTYPEKIGMFVIAEAFIDHEEWHYTNYDRSIQMHEHEIAGVVNSGVFVPSKRFNGVEPIEVVEKRQKEAEADFIPQPSKEESKFIKDEFDKHQKELKKKAKKDGETTK